MNISLEELKEIIDLANNEVINQDRKSYDPYFECFEKYAHENGLIYTLLSAVYALIGPGPDGTLRPRQDAYMITCMSMTPEKDVKKVSELLNDLKVSGPDGKKMVYYLRMNGDYVISLGPRQSFKIVECPKFRGQSVDEAVGTSEGTGLWTGLKVKCQNLFSLAGYLLSQSYDPQGKVQEDLIIRVLDMISGQITGSGPDRPKGKDKKESQRDKILKYIKTRKDVYKIFEGTGLESFLLDAPFDILRKELEGQWTIRVASYNLHDLDDFALVKYIIHDKDDRPVCVFFNSLEHQVVPILKDNRVSRRYAARIRLLEIQMFKLMKIINKDMSKSIKDLLHDYDKVRKDPDFMTESDMIGYTGKCVNWAVLKRNTSKFRGIQEFFFKEN